MAGKFCIVFFFFFLIKETTFKICYTNKGISDSHNLQIPSEHTAGASRQWCVCVPAVCQALEMPHAPCVAVSKFLPWFSNTERHRVLEAAGAAQCLCRPLCPTGSCKEIKSSLVALQNGTNELFDARNFLKSAGFLLVFGTCSSAARAGFAFLEVTVRFPKCTCKPFDVF